MGATEAAILFGVPCVLIGAFVLFMAGAIFFALRTFKKRKAGWSQAAVALELAVTPGKRDLSDLGPGIDALMKGAILLGGGARLSGQWSGREVDLVLRGETGSIHNAGGFGRPASSTPVRTDYTHVRARRFGARPFVVVSQGALAREVIDSMGPATADLGDVELDQALAVWADEPEVPRNALATPTVRESLEEILTAGWMVCVNERWAVVEKRGNITDAQTLEWALVQVGAFAERLDSVDRSVARA